MLGKLRLNPRAHLTFCSSRNLNPYIVSCSVQTSPPSQSSTKPTGPEWNSSPATMHFDLILFIAHSHKVLYYINLFLLLRKTFLNLILRLGTTPLHSLIDQHVVEAGYIGHLPDKQKGLVFGTAQQTNTAHLMVLNSCPRSGYEEIRDLARPASWFRSEVSLFTVHTISKEMNISLYSLLYGHSP